MQLDWFMSNNQSIDYLTHAFNLKIQRTLTSWYVNVFLLVINDLTGAVDWGKWLLVSIKTNFMFIHINAAVSIVKLTLALTTIFQNNRIVL